jgi:hypothetical protein
MILKLEFAKYIDGYQVDVRFNNGKAGRVDLKEVLDKGKFQELKSLQRFADFEVNQDTGVLVWGNGLDVAPEFLYERVESFTN